MTLHQSWSTTCKVFRQLMPLNEPDMVLHMVLIAVPACFGLILLLPAHTFETATVYDSMEVLMNEGAWSALSLVVATAATVAWFSKTKGMILATQMMLSFWHSLIALCFISASPYGVNSLTYAILAIAAAMRLVGLSYKHARQPKH